MYDQKINVKSNPETILITGGTGKTGRRVADKLQAMGRPIRIAARSGHPAFDWKDQNTWPAALADVTSVYIVFSPDLAVPGATEVIQAFTTLAVASGVKHLVLLSGRGEAEAQACERIVQNSGASWTIVRASWFSQNFSEGAFLGMVQEGAISLPAGDTPEPFTDVDDIADVVVAALTEEGHEYETYEVTGPRLMTFADAASEISQATGRNVRFVSISLEAFSQAIKESGLPDEYVWLLNYLFETVLDGRNAHLGDGVQRALGRAPKDFAEFCREASASGVWRLAA